MFFLWICFSISLCPSSRIKETNDYEISINECSFIGFISNEKGSVLYLDKSNFILLKVENSFFSSCFGNGVGAICFNCANGNSSFFSVCSRNTSYSNGVTHYSAAFAYILTSSKGNNNLEHVSCSRSCGLISAIEIVKGIQNIKGLNSSFNHMTYYSGIGIQQSSDCLFSFSCVSSNFASTHVIICMYNKLNMVSEFVNFCNNSQGSLSSWGLIANAITSTSSISRWVFLNNNRYAFLFANSDGTCSVHSCAVDFNYLSSQVLISTPASYSNTYSVNLFGEKYCNVNQKTFMRQNPKSKSLYSFFVVLILNSHLL